MPSLVAYVGMLTYVAVCAWRINRWSPSRAPRLMAAGVFAGILAHQVYGLTDAICNPPSRAWGTGLGISQSRGRQRPK